MPNDITEEFQVDLTTERGGATYSNRGITYDIAINDQPFRDASTSERPSQRETAQYRKDQSDNSAEPGEQSLVGWWMRSQSSFHYGSGIRFYEPAQDEKLRYRFADSQGVDVWTQGEVSLLNDVTASRAVSAAAAPRLRPITYASTQAVMLHDEYDLWKVPATGTGVQFVDYTSGTDSPIYSVCDDGVNAFFVTNRVDGTNKMHVFKKPLTGDTTTGVPSTVPTGDTTLMFSAAPVVTSAVIEWAKGRIIACINNSVYELTAASTVLPAAVFSNPSTSFVFTDVTASASDIYLSGYNGDASVIYRIPLETTGAFTALTAGIVVAEFPRGEIVQSIEAYLGFMAIGTSKGVRVAQLLADGGIVYGPLLFETSHPVQQFAVSDRFLWAACGVGTDAGTVRIDLGTQIDTLRFAYANDLQAVGVTGTTGGVAFIGNRQAFAAAGGNLWIEDTATLRTSGYITTGRIRYNTTEDKYFKFVKERADYTGGGSIAIGVDGGTVSIADGAHGNQDIALSGAGSYEYRYFTFTLQRNTLSTGTGPVLSGYQVKALPASRRQRLIQYVLYCYDNDNDRLGNRVGYKGRAYARLLDLENLEATSNIVRVQDFRTGEAYDALIEQTSFVNEKAPSGTHNGFGGILRVTVRKL
jgi:hypothetical protein